MIYRSPVFKSIVILVKSLNVSALLAQTVLPFARISSMSTVTVLSKYCLSILKRKSLVLHLALFLGATSIVSAQNCTFITNGDFQMGNFFPAPWQATGNVTHVQGANKFARFNDNNNPSNATLEQVITTTECTDYELTFELREGGNTALSDMMGLSVDVNGVDQGSFFATGGSYTTFTVPFTSTSASTTILFTDVSLATAGIDVHLDNVEVCEIGPTTSDPIATLTVTDPASITVCDGQATINVEVEYTDGYPGTDLTSILADVTLPAGVEIVSS